MPASTDIRNSPSGKLKPAGGGGGTPARANKDMAASTTAADGDLACATPMASNPAASTVNGGGIDVLVNGVTYVVGDGIKTDDCYFSDDGGVTALDLRDVSAGSLLYWVGSVAGFELSASTDRIDFQYLVD